MLNKIITFARSPWFWLGLLIMALASESVALYYQYGLDLGPCVECIRIRIWLMGIAIVAGAGLWLHRFPLANALLYAVNTGLTYGMLHTSHVLLGTERGTLFGSCGMSLGLPSWFALDQWFPTLFAVWESCGKTPELLFGITMAEGLTVLSWALLLLSGALLLIQLTGIVKKAG
jgi:protein dithiol:quinone oxidoreductase